MFFDNALSIANGVLYALLALASLFTMRLTKSAASHQLCLQVNAWWRIFPLVTVALLFYPQGLVGLAILISMLAIHELAAHIADSTTPFRFPAMVLALVVIAYCDIYPLLVLFLVLGTGLLCVLFWLSKRDIVLIWALLGITLLCVCTLIRLTRLPLAATTARDWIFFLLVVTAVNDIGQFVFGKWLGRRKIVPTISPNKTWEGLIGGVTLSLVVSLLLGSWLELAAVLPLISSAIILALVGFLGDILFSAAKRFIGIKDFSSLIPGHGGILDRVDSLTMTAPALYVLLSILY
ncbi:phosphatidate cytidylyltransferase [Serratia microhaemolytica]|uniref:phosphatidate cytidylyltransferase n=1 Tax=Serratia microhaemolytica TaxID=2675110 RepID=UPI000FDDC18C|nr:phosphatidate cytidylyltransferase [Serratia microhaemolytica]